MVSREFGVVQTPDTSNVFKNEAVTLNAFVYTYLHNTKCNHV